MLGYCLAPVVVAENPRFRLGDGPELRVGERRAPVDVATPPRPAPVRREQGEATNLTTAKRFCNEYQIRHDPPTYQPAPPL